MVTFQTEPHRLLRMYKYGLPLKGQKFCPILFSPNKVEINHESSNVITLAQFRIDKGWYFCEYESEKSEYFVMIPEHAKVIRQGIGFKGDELVNFKTDDKYAYVVGDTTHQSIQFPLIPLPKDMEHSKYEIVRTPYGMMPTLNGNWELLANVHVLVAIENFLRLPKNSEKDDQVVLFFDGGKIEVYSTGLAVNHFSLNVQAFAYVREPIVAYFNKADFFQILKQFSGEVWFGIGKFGIVVSQFCAEWWITHILRAEKVEEEL